MKSPVCALIAALTIMVAPVFALKSAAQTMKKGPVALELVLAIDTSTSVDASEFILQRNGLANAFRHPAVIRSIEALGPQGAAVALVQWAGPSKQSMAVDWQVLDSAASARSFAARIDDTSRAHRGFTDIGGAIAFSTAAIKSNAYEGARAVIDVSGDGASDRNDPAPFRDAAIASGITVNGLVIYSQEYDLGDLARIALHDHYTNRVIGGDGAFLMEADSFEDFSEAIRRKLVREISGDDVAGNAMRLRAALSDSRQAR